MSRQAGFTLLEALIAFAIAAMALAVLFEGAGEAIRGTEAARLLTGAVDRARSHLAEAGARIGGEGEQVEEGDEGLYHYRVSLTPLRKATARRQGRPSDAAVSEDGVRLYRLEVEERWEARGRPRVFTLRSERLFVGAPARGSS